LTLRIETNDAGHRATLGHQRTSKYSLLFTSIHNKPP